MTKELETAIKDFIAEGNGTSHTQRNGVEGILFKGRDKPPEGEFIPLNDLGYNSKLGFFRRSDFPDESSI